MVFFMELDEFVKETLLQITKGVADSQLEISKIGGIVNPAIRLAKQSSDSHVGTLYEGQNVYIVDFDIAISVSEGTGSKADGKLTVASLFSVGGGTSSSETNSTLSKVSFKVPLALPVDNDSIRLMEHEEFELLQKKRNAQKERSR